MKAELNIKHVSSNDKCVQRIMELIHDDFCILTGLCSECSDVCCVLYVQTDVYSVFACVEML